MATLSIEQINIIVEGSKKTPQWVLDARKEHKRLLALIKGKGFQDLLQNIEGIEPGEKRFQARKKYSRSIKDLNQRLLRPIDNVYSATGGNKIYNIDNEDKLSELIKKIGHIRDNKSLEKWLENAWMLDGYHADPNGVIFLEYKVDEDMDKCWPTYKSINIIRNYKSRGQNLEWILFEPETVKTEDGKSYELARMVDDQYDYLIKIDGANIVILEQSSFQHEFGECPGVINSDIQEINSELRLSPIDEITEVQEEYLRDQSILTIYKFLDGFPKFWRYTMFCKACQGTGKKNDKPCPSCDGKGKLVSSDITDVIELPIPSGAPNDIKLAPDVAGYIAPELKTWDQYHVEKNLLETSMNISHWGADMNKIKVSIQPQTATAEILDVQPVENRLNKYSDTAQFVEKQLTEWIANFLDPNKPKDQSIAVILYGRNYIMLPPEALLKKYNEAKKENAPITVLDRMLIEYITSKFKYDPESLMSNLKKKELEYYVHYSVEEISKELGVIEAQKKILFTDWWEQLGQKEILDKSVEDLLKMRNEWMSIELTNLGSSVNQNLENESEN